ncbi:MAG: FG-GAP-like repeat-containing protein, partial [Acidobacteriota bacterium]|nr:FG-GAP-like repeat-containing protein [Acidobacteriota bacterium]
MDIQPVCLTRSFVVTLVTVVVLTTPAVAQDRLTVMSVGPLPRALQAPSHAVIGVEFDRPIDPSSITNKTFWAFGRWSGVVHGDVKILGDGRRIRLTPDRRFSAGEVVTVVLSRDLRAIDGTTLRDSGFSYQFWTRSKGNGFEFSEVDRFSTRSNPAVSTRSYGGFGSDLNDDGFLDLTIVNEDTDDLRTFLNRADRTGTFHDFLRPTRRTGNVPSPSEPSDFDRDGRVDVVVANTQDDSVSVFLGKGDGTFRRAVHYTVGGEPRGVTVLDADGDGAMDIAATSFVAGTVTVLFNDGSGGFDRTDTFGTSAGERALAAADMNGDGILDLVVGALSAERIDVYLGNGDGTFSSAGSQLAGGQVWMLVLGDVDGDGSEDVAAVNGQSNNAAILLGDGGGGLAPPITIETDPFPLATDLADLDGDGDLDWVTSSFSGDWILFENDGRGNFNHERSFDAPQAASCSIPMDLDNDEVVDLVLIDELEDEIVLMKSHAVLFESDFESGTSDDWAKAPGTMVVQPGLGSSDYALEVTVREKRAYAHTKFRPEENSLVVSFDLDLQGFDP